MNDPVRSDIRLHERRPVVILRFDSTRQRLAFDEEYGPITMMKMLSGAAAEADPEQQYIVIQLPPGKNEPLIPLAAAGEREIYNVAVFERGKHIRETNLIEYIYRRTEERVVDDSGLQQKLNLFRPGVARG